MNKKMNILVNKLKKSYRLLFLVLVFLSLKANSQTGSGKVIGMYEWLTHNLSVTHFRNGDPIPEAKSKEEWRQAMENHKPAFCYYNNKRSSKRKYGLLYNWYAVNDSRGLSPKGWDIPGREELQSLLKETGNKGGMKLKSKSGWQDMGGGSDEMGFAAVPSGIRNIGTTFLDQGKYAYYWTKTSHRGERALYYNLGYKHDNIDTTHIFSYLRKGSGMAVRCVRRVSFDGFTISPGNVPNEGIMFVDHESKNRSGHYGSAITTCTNGDILAFYTDVSSTVLAGHGIAGWSLYKRSRDGGKTWGEPVILDYSKNVWNSNKFRDNILPKGKKYHSARATAVVTAPNGTLVAFISRQLANNQNNYVDFKTPVYLLSYDHGLTWTEPREVDEKATSQDISLTNEDGASFVHEGVIYTVFIGGHGEGGYSLYASRDNGETFSKLSDGLFRNKKYKKNFFYMSAKALDDGRFIVYAYNIDDELNFPYIISEDKGKTWSEVRTTPMAKRIRGAQMSEKFGDYYFMVGRSGVSGYDPGNLVLYASKNGIDWDNGRYLSKVQKTLDSYSAIEVVRESSNAKAAKVLIQATVGYGVGASVNVKHWWIEDLSK